MMTDTASTSVRQEQPLRWSETAASVSLPTGSVGWLGVRPVAAMWAILAGTAVLACFAAIMLDEPVARMMRAAPPAVGLAAAWVSMLGLSGYMLAGSAAIALAALLAARRQGVGPDREGLIAIAERACLVFAAVAGSGLLAQVLKHLVGRARPKLIETLGPFHFDWFSIKASLASMPSGHATSIFALAVAVGSMWPRVRFPLLALAVMVGASRVIGGSHYLSDVIAGAALGTVVTLGLAVLFARRGVVFAIVGGALRLKAAGAVRPALSAVLRRIKAAP